ncbi:MAG: dihydroxyacetone kinase subunit DhaL [Alphaproteobacteria bacterium]|nr:dihydroxyacetone kinase subunit DhaL [Alphaproteobacteria bacterium]
MKNELNAQAVSAMMQAVSLHVIANTDALTDADLAIGDGDHGIGMRRGFEAVLQQLSDWEPESPEAVMKQSGMAIMSKTGGAAGAVFGTVFRSGSKALAGVATIDAASLGDFLSDGCAAAAKRGGAAPGQKTMLDALAPAAEAARKHAPDGLYAALDAAHASAVNGLEKTRAMVATTGKARSLGERSIGHIDPGALSICLIIEAMRDFAKTT